MERLWEGAPTCSTGRLSIAQLAAEAGVQRWRLTHQHTDLKDQLQTRTRELEAGRATRAKVVDTLAVLQEQHAELRRHCAVLEKRLRTHATVVNLLTLENDALRSREGAGTQALPFPRRTETLPRPEPAPMGT